MELYELYNQIKNPIEDSDVIKKLIIAYSNSSMTDFYDKLVRIEKKQYTHGEHYKKDRDEFYAMMFNKWKNSIVNLTKQEFSELYKKGLYDRDLVKLREYLKTIPDVTTKEEADYIFYSHKDDKELENAIGKYRWNAVGENNVYTHVCSKYLTAKKDKFPNVKHRLYLNTESIDTYSVISLFAKKCDKYHLPYYFKFVEIADRDESIVIYSSTENLTKYMAILQEIKNERPDIVSRCKNPPVLTGKVDEWIGYGSEPMRISGQPQESFNSKRADIIENAIDKTTKNWILKHQNMQMMFNNERISFKDYIAIKSSDYIIEKIKENFNSYAEIHGNASTTRKFGYSLQEVESPSFKKEISGKLRKCMDTMLNGVCHEPRDKFSYWIENTKNINIVFSNYNMQQVIESLATKIARNDPSFIKAVQKEIQNQSLKNGIDPYKYCFDIDKVKEIREIKRKKDQIMSIDQYSEEFYGYTGEKRGHRKR